MTIICALHDPKENVVWLGCNDRATIGDTPAPASENKWLKFGSWAVGLTCNECVYKQYLQLSADKFPETAENVLEVFDFLRSRYKKYNLGQQKGNDTSTSYGAEGIIVRDNGEIWDFDSHLALSKVPSGRLWGGGSGIDYALGADHIMQGDNAPAQTRIQRAVEAAIALDIGCPGEPIVERFSRS